jgi:hypothetical protein
VKLLQLVTLCILAATANALTVEEARANLDAARAAYTNALHEAGITNTPRRTARARARKAAQTATARNSVLTRRQQSFFENRRICTRRDAETLPGFVISYWERNGKPDTIGPAVVTNAVRQFVGIEQHNPLHELVELWRVEATNAKARVERVSAALDEKRAEYEQKRDAATLPTTKAIYQAFMDAIDRIKERLGADE